MDAYFSDGRERVRLVEVDGDRLILDEGPRRLIGPGESVNIVHPSLEVLGSLTETDRRYLEAMRSVGLERVMLSYVETPEDVEEVKELLPDAEVMLKIETRKGLALVRDHGAGLGRLMAARGDLFIEVERPHRIVGAVRQIVEADPDAVVASRILESLADDPVPESAEIGDVAHLIGLGYRTIMLGDRVSLRRDSVVEALDLLEAIAAEVP